MAQDLNLLVERRLHLVEGLPDLVRVLADDENLLDHFVHAQVFYVEALPALGQQLVLFYLREVFLILIIQVLHFGVEVGGQSLDLLV